MQSREVQAHGWLWPGSSVVHSLLSSGCWLLSLGLSPRAMKMVSKALIWSDSNTRKESEAGEKTLSLEFSFFFFFKGRENPSQTLLRRFIPMSQIKLILWPLLLIAYKGDWESKELIFLTSIVLKQSLLGENIRGRKVLDTFWDNVESYYLLLFGAKSCLTFFFFCNPMDGSSLGFFVHRTSQEKLLEG